ncbi:MAG: glutamate-5-semialdehyde dehydrogenase [Anaerolineaceae bacterium]|nr:glutamate-5-semialdehyde dehydrogenase [Anaerolineaceae bacterium]|tara:strand:- start:3498 stop:4772 length:1275 start_codon:yes stop_codon:yes gene_type:complete
MIDLTVMAAAAKNATRQMAHASTEAKNIALKAIANNLEQSQNDILSANERDINEGHNNGLNSALIDRLTLTPERLDAMAADVINIASLPDPIGERFDSQVLENGLQIERQRVPIGVLGVIYESRPNVTIDVTALAIKTGNVVLLRGGSETMHSNRVLVNLVQQALCDADLPESSVQFIDNRDRKYVAELLKLHEYVEMIIPRGSNTLHTFCRENSTIPVITGGIGICHLYVDESADINLTLPVIENAKVQRPSVCNALDTLLVHEAIAADLIPRIVEQLGESGVTFRADNQVLSILEKAGLSSDSAKVQLAGPDDFDIEWLSLVLGIKIVKNLDEAIEHIHKHSTNHSDGILTETDKHAERFVTEIDSAAVYVNSSTRFTDGGQLGLGAEVAVSTQRLHARGPMGLPELSTYKWVVRGSYTSRS